MDDIPSQFTEPPMPGVFESDYQEFLRFQQFRRQGETLPPVQPETGGPGEPSHTPTAGSAIPQVSLDDLLVQPGRDKLIRLDPDREDGATWFTYSSAISKTILKLIRDLNHPYPTYASMPRELRDGWFRAFAQEYTWDVGITSLVRDKFDEQAKASMSNNMYEWKKRWLAGQGKPKWMSERLWSGYVEYWNQERTREISGKNSSNRRSTRGGEGIAIHNMGSKSYQRRKQELTEYNGGEEPSMLELLRDTHTSKKTGLINDGKVRRIVDTVQEQVQELASQRCIAEDGASSHQSNVSVSEINRLVIEATPKVRGRRLGFGSLPDPSEGTSRRADAQAAELERLRELTAQQSETIADLQSRMSFFMTTFYEKFPDANPEPPVHDDDETQG